MHPALGDDPSKYDTIVHHGEVVGVWIKVQDNGDCIYRGVDGCNIWKDRPALCRAFDCRKYLRIADKFPVVDPDVIARGRELME